MLQNIMQRSCVAIENAYINKGKQILQYLPEIKQRKARGRLTKGGMIPLYWGNPGPTGGWGRGKAGLPAGGFLGGPWD